MTLRTLIVILLLIVTGNPHAYGSDDKSQTASATWQEDARKRGLSDAEIASLEKNDLLLTNQEYRQIYAAYAPSDIPVFITSDSLLNAYHVLLEESIGQREFRQVARLSETLKLILKDLETLRFTVRDQPELNAAAQRRARLVIGIAVRLLDKSFRLGDAALDEILAAESMRIETATEVFLPEWLGAPSPSLIAIHYSRFKPRSFYTRNVKLERYFRAVSWLQAIPFRIDQDEELLAMLMLGHALRDRPPEPADEARGFNLNDAAWDASDKFRNTFRFYYELVGDPDLPDILEAADETGLLARAEPETLEEEMPEELPEELDSDDEIPEVEHSEDPQDGQPEVADRQLSGGVFGPGGGEGGFGDGAWVETQEKVLLLQDLRGCRESLRLNLRKRRMKPEVSDHDRLPPKHPEDADEFQFRVISASRTPDSVLFQRTADLRRFDRPFPSGLEVAIALGSSAARSFLVEPEKEQVLQEIDSCKELFHTENLYGSWLNTLMALFDEPEHDAPEFMRSDAWQRKSCNTVLASWTQLRHTYALHAKINGGYGGGRIPPPGFVEPDPDFFSRMADLAEQTKWTLNSDDELQPLSPDYRPLLPMLESMKGLANGVADTAAMDKKLKERSEIEDILRSLSLNLNELVVLQGDSEVLYGDRWNQAVDDEFSPEKIELIRNLAAGVPNSFAMYEKFRQQPGESVSRNEMLRNGLKHWADEHPGKELAWSDRWCQVCDQCLPQVIESLRRLADGIADNKVMEA